MDNGFYPIEIQRDADELANSYTEGQQLQDIKNVIIDEIITERRKEFVQTLESLNNTKNED